MLKKRFVKLLEAAIDDEYSRNFNTIPREIFDQIVVADPKSKVINNVPQGIGFGAKALLLPQYLKGNTDFIDELEEVTKALTTYYTNQKNYPDKFKNLANFPSIEDFMNFVEDPNIEINVNIKDTSSNPIDDIYTKYFLLLNN